jgi:hypothetical protein
MTEPMLPSRLNCPFPGCKQPGRPFMCNEHWQLVPGDVRRALVKEVYRLKNLGQKKPSPWLIELHTSAMKSVAKKLDDTARFGR